MSYTKNTWVDQDVERPKTYEVTNNQDGSITLTDSFGLVTELGTPVNAVNMNHIEDGIDGCAIRKHNLTETFALGEWVLGGTGDDEGIYKSLIANNVGNAVTDDTKWEKVKMGGSSRNVGEIISSTLPLTDAGLHLLDGTLLQYGIYKEFIDYIANLYAENPNANYFTTESAWQQSVTTYGVCGKFVYDSVNNTVRLPKYSNKIYTKSISSTASVVGDGLALGLTVGSSYTYGLSTDKNPNRLSAYSTAYGKPIPTSGLSEGIYPDSNKAVGVVTDPTKSGLIAQLSDITTSLDGYYYIVIATSTKTDVQVDIDEIATDLNGKADTDLTNVTNTGYIKMAGASMPSNRYINLTLGASGTTYTAPANGWAYIDKTAGGTLKYVNLGCGVVSEQMSSFDTMRLKCFIPVRKGASFRCDYNATGTLNIFRFYYAVGSESEAQ